MGDVLFSHDAGIGRITINRPDQGNALNPSALAGLRSALRSAGESSEVRVIAITGAGERVFCAGADLKTSLGDAPESFGRGDYRGLLLDVVDCPKPTVALARGHVMAGGLGILLACDLALACDDVHFSTPEIRVGMFPMMVLALLYRHVGRKRAAEMLFLGERLPAASALAYGIVNRIFPRNRFEESTTEFLGGLADKSSSILRLGKEAIRRVEYESLPRDLEFLETALAQVMSTEDSREGIRAFVEKRSPVWKHR